ncbi:GNAT family N-acetyltransferase [Cellulomonas sp. ATA003]|uniref:GNAT family N-acetyltransferase n=1 Tax=Cellulomonas sp. ATA003 TaxID=3073064 RepID=UPI002873EA7A|nr:GNAT family N-acetyltransferase [Cellulomonas sp. ATA003]WNB86907.1 GNAT family N-acetyltransferase [Cellulomonas sp. ATA003]
MRPPHPWLYGLGVAPAARRHGIGRLLTAAAETQARLHGFPATSLDVDRDAVGLVAFYQRLGYERVGPHEHHWQTVDPATGRVTARGTSSTWIMRHTFPAPADEAHPTSGPEPEPEATGARPQDRRRAPPAPPT